MKHNGHDRKLSATNKMQYLSFLYIHCVPKNDTALACYNFDVHQPIFLTIFGSNVAKYTVHSD